MHGGRPGLGTWIGSATLGVAFLACSSSNGGGPDAASDASSGASSDAPSGSTSVDGAPHTLGACYWPDSLNDAGAGACTVGRTFLNCVFPSGAGCGVVSSPGPLTEGCISSDLTGCPGCDPAPGATCEDQCGPDEYAVSCGGPPHFPDDGSFTYQQAPAGCRDVGSTPGGNTYSCCPCDTTPGDGSTGSPPSTDGGAGTDAAPRSGCAACGTNQVCAYAIADGCGAAGTCVTPPAPSPCNALAAEMACGCDGSEVDWTGGCQPSLPEGYAPAPVVHMGTCH